MRVVDVPTSRRQPVVVERWPVRLSVAAGALGAGAGAAIEYLLDPARGRTRRARLRDQSVHGAHKLGHGLTVAVRDSTNRGRGMLYGLRYRIRGRDVDDVVLQQRVRAVLGRYLNHPHAVSVAVRDGVVTLTGDVLAAESGRVLRAVRKVPGVKRLEERWRVHQDATGVPGLQGGSSSREPAPELLQQHWSPAARLAAGAGATAAWVAAGRLPGPLAWMLRAASAVVAARAAANLPLRRLLGVGAGRRAVDVREAISVAAPPSAVWELISDYAHFPAS